MCVPSRPPNPTQGHATCKTEQLVRPTSTAELSDAVKNLVARAAAEGRPLKLRATRDSFASMPSFPCTSQPSDPAGASYGSANGRAPLVAALLLQNMNKLLSVDQANKRLTVQGQMTIKELFAAATANGMSIPRASLPWWQGLTLAGIMSTTSHGSGLNQTSMIVSGLLLFFVGGGVLFEGAFAFAGLC